MSWKTAQPLEIWLAYPTYVKVFYIKWEQMMSIAAMAEDLPKPAWIALMVLGFIAFWPIGLGILAYLWWSGKLTCWKHGNYGNWARHGANRFGSSGNAAFDEYREETLRRLEEEQKEFKAFVDRLRRAKDQREFDQFMAERNGSAKPAAGRTGRPDSDTGGFSPQTG